MDYSYEEFKIYIEEEDVKFIRLVFCDVYGRVKNISIMPSALESALTKGVAINASRIKGFTESAKSDLFLHPDPSTTAILPWRPEHGRVIRMFCDIKYEDGTPFEADTRWILKQAIEKAKARNISFRIGSRMEFYLFKTNEDGEPTNIPYDKAGYMDVAPLDKGENVRREICLSLEKMGITPIHSHHEAGPGQNEIDFASADPLTAADHALTFIALVKTIAARHGLYADFSPKPLANKPGNGFHINVSMFSDDSNHSAYGMAGMLANIYDSSIFFNTTEKSYERLGEYHAPKYISWSTENHDQLIRIPPTAGEHHYAQLRLADPLANPYLAFALIIYSVLDGIDKKLELQNATNFNIDNSDAGVQSQFKALPHSINKAREAAKNSDFIKSCIDAGIIKAYC